jgi:Zn-dependent protease
MRPQFRLGSIAGIPIGVNLGAVLIAVLLSLMLAFGLFPYLYPGGSASTYLVAGVLTAGLFGASLLAHELAHALTARRRGIVVEDITLWLLGGMARLRNAADSPRAELAVAAVGPAISAVLAGGLSALAGLLGTMGISGVPVAVLDYVAGANLLLALFNLLPAAPLDGGRILQAVVWWRTGDRARGTRVAATAGRWLGVGVAGIGAFLLFTDAALNGIWLAMIGGFIAMAATAEQQTSTLEERLTGMRVADVMTAEPVTGIPSFGLAYFIEQTALPDPHNAYPLVDLDGRLAGLVTLERIRRVPVDQRAWTRLADVAVPAGQVITARPGELLTDLLARLGRRDDDQRAVVLDAGGRVIGIVTRADIARAALLAELRITTRVTTGSR